LGQVGVLWHGRCQACKVRWEFLFFCCCCVWLLRFLACVRTFRSFLFLMSSRVGVLVSGMLRCHIGGVDKHVQTVASCLSCTVASSLLYQLVCCVGPSRSVSFCARTPYGCTSLELWREYNTLGPSHGPGMLLATKLLWVHLLSLSPLFPVELLLEAFLLCSPPPPLSGFNRLWALVLP